MRRAAPDDGAATETSSAAAMVTAPDTTGAAIRAHLQAVGFADGWATWPEKGTLYEGGEPHGMLLPTYLNEPVREALESGAAVMPAGAVIVKEKYMLPRSGRARRV